MSKRGVFGTKRTPLDPPHGHTEPGSVHIKTASNGFVVHTVPGKNGGHSDTHVAADMPGVMKLVRAHLDQILANDMDGVTNSMKVTPAKAVKE